MMRSQINIYWINSKNNIIIDMNKNYNNIKFILGNLGIDFTEIEHQESHSCEESKKFRNEKWLSWLGSKNIVFHCKWNYYLITTHWDKNIKARNFKHEFGSKDIRFANQEEITLNLDVIIWSIPPFGFENSSIPIFVDVEIFESEYFIFNPSVPTKSIRVKTENLKKIYNSLPNPVKYFKHSEEEFELFEELSS